MKTFKDLNKALPDGRVEVLLLAKTADIGLAWQDFITLGIGTDDLPAFSSADMGLRA